MALAVRDVARSQQWYIDVLGFEHRHAGMWNGVPVFVGKGSTAIALFPAGSDDFASRRNGGSGMLHLAFGTSARGFLAAQEEFTTRGVAFHFQDHEISRSIYFQDPDGHELEITTYEIAT